VIGGLMAIIKSNAIFKQVLLQQPSLFRLLKPSVALAAMACKNR